MGIGFRFPTDVGLLARDGFLILSDKAGKEGRGEARPPSNSSVVSGYRGGSLQ